MKEPKINPGALGEPQWIRDTAYFDPRLAWLLLSCGRGNCIAPSGWEILNLLGRWDDGAANTPVQAHLSDRLDTDVWVRRVTYTVRRPNFAVGSLWKAQSDYYNMKNPNIAFEMQIKSFCNYFIAQDPTPLENIPIDFECVCPAGLVLKCNSQIRVTYTNLVTFTDDEVPTEAIISLHGVTLPPNLYSSCDVPTAIANLQDRGILPDSYTAPPVE